MIEQLSFKVKRMGVIRTLYIDNAPYQPLDEANGDFRVVIDRQYAGGLYKLAEFHNIYVIYYMHHIVRRLSMVVSPPWAGGARVGLFASRSAVRPNPIGLGSTDSSRPISTRSCSTSRSGRSQLISPCGTGSS
jgi:tRNA (Thr-GGU) A37 N-methylase